MDNNVVLDEAGVQKIEFKAMGSHIMAAIESADPRAAELLAQVPAWFARWEQVLSRFKDDSELSFLNRLGPESSPVRVSDTLWNVLQLALMAARDTEGLVTPTVLNALEAAGYDATFDEIKDGIRRRTKDEEHALSAVRGRKREMEVEAQSAGKADRKRKDAGTWRDIKIYPRAKAVSLPRGMRLDFGGVAKGWAADEAVRMLANYGPALVDAGGDIAVSPGAGRVVNWPVGVDAPSSAEGIGPDEAGNLLDLLSISAGGVATSGVDYRRWQKDGQWRHHIIDPRTGLPAQTDVLTVTVIAPTACAAEVAAKAVLLLGSKEGLTWLDRRPGLAGLLVLEDGEVLRSQRFENYVWSSN